MPFQCKTTFTFGHKPLKVQDEQTPIVMGINFYIFSFGFFFLSFFMFPILSLKSFFFVHFV